MLADTLRRSEAKFEGVERGVKGDLTALLLRPPGEEEAPPSISKTPAAGKPPSATTQKVAQRATKSSAKFVRIWLGRRGRW